MLRETSSATRMFRPVLGCGSVISPHCGRQSAATINRKAAAGNRAPKIGRQAGRCAGKSSLAS
jgi:hypothetical protein